MSALNPQTLFEESKCYACYGVTMADMLVLALLNRINPLDCGTPTLTVLISGAGEALANGSYVSVDGGAIYTNSNGYTITKLGTTRRILSPSSQPRYLITADQFPCGNWTLGSGPAPRPTGAYV